ncbi:MAG: hypothetical protein E7Z93_05195 [Cyanobacteria bacterium SIG32]|nr:hypothetical protein [Cyanobacteria bacterium SIG32]
MRELIAKDQRIIMVPHDFKFANKGTITEVQPDYFTLELDYDADGILRSNYCEFYTQTSHGTLYFDSYAKEINGKTLKIASPAKHKFLQRRQYTRIKYILDLDMFTEGETKKITTLDISAGGMKFKTNDTINIDKDYTITLPLSEEQSIECKFSPIRIEKNNENGYTISGRFDYNSSMDKMTLTQYCAKRSIEIKNK